MNKFFLKSTDTDFQKLIQQVNTIHKNVLYITYQVDFIRKRVQAIETNEGLQKQVSDFYNQDPEDALVDDIRRDND